MSEKNLELEKMAMALEASGQFKVLRRLGSQSFVETADGSETRIGLFIDVETTGLDPSKDDIIELAMVPFVYGIDGRIFQIKPTFQKFHQPKSPIPPEITALTGITNEMVEGKSIDSAEVTNFVSEASLIVAHNASFDRRFAERLCDAFVVKPWACSMTQIDWAMQGYEGTKLAYLTMQAGFFYERHRAANDCVAAIQLLATRLPKSNARAMSQLLDRARQPTWRIWAENAPFDLKDVLKARGYRWNGDSNPNPRAWCIDVSEADRERELTYLRNEIYQREIDLFVKKITAYERFSIRS